MVINEIAWMGTLPKEGESVQAAANNEWLELFNNSGNSVSLEGWKIVAPDDNMPEIFLSGSISAGGYFLLERSSDEVIPWIAADLIYPYKNNALSNSGEHLFLKDKDGSTVDEIDASGGWPAGDNNSKDTMQKSGSGWTTASSTPRVVNAGTTSPSPSPSPSPTPPASTLSSQSSSGPVVTESISSYAGENKKAVVGSSIEFLGRALGINGEPLENARFWWNFGDGETKEGRMVTHIFHIPGKYTVGLHVSSGFYSASDYISVEVSANLVRIESVVEGREGFVRIKNPSDVEMDLGGWFLSDGRSNFFIPPRTKIGAGADVSFLNEITGLLAVDEIKSVSLRFPNGTLAVEWKEKDSVAVKPQAAPVVSAEVSSEEKEVIAVADTAIVPSQETPVKSEEKTAAAGTQGFWGGKMFFALAVILALISSVVFILSKKFID